MKLIRITTVPGSLKGLLKGQMSYMVKNGFEVIGVSSPGEDLQLVHEVEGVPVKAVKMTRTISPIKDLMATYRLIRLFKSEKPDIVHTHTPKAGLLGMLASRIAGVPYRLHTVAGMPLLVATGNKRKLLNLIEKLTYACATKVYPNSLGLKEIILQERFTTPAKLKVIGYGSSNGINTDQFDRSIVSQETIRSLKGKIGLNDDDFVFLFVGRVVKDKGINELVEAFVKLNIIYPKTKLLLVGSFERDLDPLKDETEKQIEENNNIKAVGFQKNVIDYFAMANVLTFPSYREGFPNVVMQAASMQLNCIVSDINGCNEIIKDGENGWIVPVKDANILLARMKWCFENSEISNQMGKDSRKMMQEHFERSFVWNEILKEYRSLIK